MIVAAVFLFLTLLLFVYANTLRPPHGPTPPDGPPDPRVLRPYLDDARTNVRRYLQQLDPTVTDDDVRANIFLPQTTASAGGSGVALGIPSRLCLNMNLAIERDITFQPGEGATGQAYQRGDALIACRDPSTTVPWDAKYRLTPDQVHRIHPELRWVISLPIKADSGSVVGVANVDCLKHEFSYNDLEHCADIAAAFVELMGKLF